MTGALHWVRSDKSPVWYLRSVVANSRGYVDEDTGTTWPEVVPIAAGHPDPSWEAALASTYARKAEAERMIEETKQRAAQQRIEEIVAPRRRGILAFFTGRRG